MSTDAKPPKHPPNPPPNPLPNRPSSTPRPRRRSAEGRTIGLDLGGSRCGVAMDDELGLVAHPRPNLEARDRKHLVETLAELARAENGVRFVLGLPLDPSGNEGRPAERVRTFAQHLADRSGLEVVLWDERFTTVEAARALQTSGLTAKQAKAHIDAAAAMKILQAWLDANPVRRGREP